ncbi:hypothetical protein QYS36_20790 [Pseudomonas sp. G34]|nr:hypothetical protein [Pseudomonas sp. G34]MDQ7987383.1 hypothetical protein [Pseudomonas sp. G34]
MPSALTITGTERCATVLTRTGTAAGAAGAAALAVATDDEGQK